MGRILEALRSVSRRLPMEVPGKRPPDRNPEQPAKEETPFIEVGGKAIEGSADVLACAVPSKPKAEMKTTGTPPQPLSSPTSPTAIAKTTTIEFRPMPASRTLEKSISPELIAFHDPHHPISQEFHALVEAMKRQLTAGGSQVLLFTAGNPGDSTTSIVLNLAVTMARPRSRVVVCEIGGPGAGLKEKLGLAAGPGLAEILTGSISVKNALRETIVGQLQVLQAGEMSHISKSALAGDPMRTVLRQLRNQFDWVLLDAPPWNQGPEMAGLCSACDAAYLVLRQSEIQSCGTENLVQAAARHGIRVRGCVVTH